MKKGFTLIELLIVIAIIAILAAVVFVALDPLSRFQEARNSTRWSDVSAVLDAAKLNQIDNSGTYLASIVALSSDANATYTIGTCGATGGNTGCTAATTQAACADLTGLVTAGQIASIPMDPSTGTAAKTDYYIQKSSTGTLTIGACDPEGGDVIQVKR